MAIFGRFTQRAQQAMQAAQQTAVSLNHPYVGTEHILLGLLKEPSEAVASLLDSRVNYDSVYALVEQTIGKGDEANKSWKPAFWNPAV